MEKEYKIRNKTVIFQCLVMGSLFLTIGILHLFLKTGWGDEIVFAGDAMPLGEFLVYRYRVWSSRVIIEAGVKILAASPVWIWKTLNTLALWLLIWIAADLFGVQHKNTKIQAQLFFFTALWSLPALSLCDAGWIATTLNYLWPLTLGLIAMRPIKHWLKGDKCPAWEYVICPVCAICASNVEQGAAVLLGVYLLSGAWLLRKKRKLSGFYIALVCLAAASAVFILTTPGNECRLTVETNQWFPGYSSLSVSEKLMMGFIDSMNYYLSAGGGLRSNFVFALFSGILLACALQRGVFDKARPRVIAAALPFLFYWGIGQIGNRCLLTTGIRWGGNIIGLFGQNRCLPTGAGTFQYLGWISYPGEMVGLQAVVYLGLLLCMALTIYYLHGKSTELLLQLVILGIGLCSTVIMGFSPTIYASGERTSLYCSIAILIVCLRNLQFYWNKAAGKREKAVLGIYILFVLCVSVRESGMALEARISV